MKESTKEEIKSGVKDILISIVIVAVIFLSLYAYSQVWPPIVVIESGSMMHGNDSHIGTIDTGDIVLVKRVYSPDDIISYVEGRAKGYKTYGDYGDVIVYKYNGRSIIHRAMVYLKWNGERWVIRGFENGNYPSWLYVANDHITIYDVGYEKKTVIIYTDMQHLNPNIVGDEGFITMGDHNLVVYGSTAYDQNGADGFLPICPKLVNFNMIVGVARGELPWFGALKLYITGTNTNEIPPSTNFYLAMSLAGIIALSIGGDYVLAHRHEIWMKIKKLVFRKDYKEKDGEEEKVPEEEEEKSEEGR